MYAKNNISMLHRSVESRRVVRVNGAVKGPVAFFRREKRVLAGWSGESRK